MERSDHPVSSIEKPRALTQKAEGVLNPETVPPFPVVQNLASKTRGIMRISRIPRGGPQGL